MIGVGQQCHTLKVQDMSVGREQIAVALIEHDVNDDTMCVWNYPGLYLSASYV